MLMLCMHRVFELRPPLVGGMLLGVDFVKEYAEIRTEKDLDKAIQSLN